MRITRAIGIAGIGVVAGGTWAVPARAAPAAAALYARGIPGKVAACASCHGAQAQGAGQLPRLAGLPAPYVLTQLAAFRDGTRTNALMQAIARPLSGAQMQALAGYLAGLAAPYPAPPAASAPALVRGAQIVTLGAWSRGVPACRDCHGPALLGGGPDIPPLAGQSQTYLLGQLEAFRSGGRPAGPLGLMARIAAKLNPEEMRDAAAYAASLRPGQTSAIPRGEKSLWRPHPQNPESFAPPPESALPANAEQARTIVLGESIFADTPKFAAKYAGDALSCRNCHTDLGRNPVSAPMWAAVPKFPQYRSKNRRVNTLAMRIQGCFRYSENGTPPKPNSRTMVALITYMHWLATGLPIGITPKASGYPSLPAPARTADRDRGRAVYTADCALCHGPNGQGTAVAGAQVFPPLWGPRSFNWGAGMHSVAKAAAFVFRNMPLGAAGTLTDQQAWDVAAWLDSQPRPQDPRFAGSVEKTRELYHKNHKYDYYGRTFDGLTLGAPGTLEAWEKKNAAGGRD